MTTVGGTTKIRGITWDHSRGFSPLVATAQVFHDFRPEFEIVWDRRSLWDFGEGSLVDLTERYDLLVVDYPMAGLAASQGLLLPLDEHVSASWLEQQAADSAGPSHQSYINARHQWATAIDAACQVSASRPDLLQALGLVVPRTWEEVIRLAGETGRVLVPLWSADTLSTFSTMCANQGRPPYRTDGTFVDAEIGLHVLDQMMTLFQLVPGECINMNPIQVLNRMANEDVAVYCPFTLGYSNYSRVGYAKHRLNFHDLPVAGSEGCKGAILGGTGLAISARSSKPAQALEYLTWVAAAECQRTIYMLSGGQPGNRVAWEDDLANAITGNFFRNTRTTLDGAQVRPSHAGMIPFQSSSGAVLREFLLGKRGATETLTDLNRLFVGSLQVSAGDRRSV
jgi:multiple sugar transport system substrate-binding protein